MLERRTESPLVALWASCQRQAVSLVILPKGSGRFKGVIGLLGPGDTVLLCETVGIGEGTQASGGNRLDLNPGFSPLWAVTPFTLLP